MEIIDFNSNSQRLMEYIDHLSETIAHIKPTDGSWSILECLEHLFITEKGIYKLLNKPELFTESVVLGQDNFHLYRTQKQKAPSFTEPTGRFGSVAELKTAYVILRDQFDDYLKNHLPLTGNLTYPHAILGPLTKVQWVEFTIDHVERHLKQMKAIEAMK